MRKDVLLRELEELAAKLGIRVRYERLVGTPGGYCVVKGDSVIIIDKRANPATKIKILSMELAKLDLSSVYIVPYVRELLEKENEP
ncbi:hypothetical protein J7K18_00190 [bacterium]|nr:hypothetical protein [bacterium]